MLNKLYTIAAQNKEELDFTKLEDEIKKIRKDGEERHRNFFKTIGNKLKKEVPVLKDFDIESYSDGILINKAILIENDFGRMSDDGKGFVWRIDLFTRIYTKTFRYDETSKEHFDNLNDLVVNAEKIMKVINDDEIREKIVNLMDKLYLQAKKIETNTKNKVEKIKKNKEKIIEKNAKEFFDWIEVKDISTGVVTKGESRVVGVSKSSITIEENGKKKKYNKKKIMNGAKLFFTFEV